MVLVRCPSALFFWLVAAALVHLGRLKLQILFTCNILTCSFSRSLYVLNWFKKSYGTGDAMKKQFRSFIIELLHLMDDQNSPLQVIMPTV